MNRRLRKKMEKTETRKQNEARKKIPAAHKRNRVRLPYSGFRSLSNLLEMARLSHHPRLRGKIAARK